MNIKKIVILLLFLVAIIGIIAPINAVDSANNKVKIKWDANGGKIGSKKTVTTTVNKGSKIGTLQKATRTGYTLKGWYTKKTGGTKISKSTKLKKSTTYYAQWEKSTTKPTTVEIDKNKIVGKWSCKTVGDFTFNGDGSAIFLYKSDSIKCGWEVQNGKQIKVWDDDSVFIYFTYNGKNLVSNRGDIYSKA